MYVHSFLKKVYEEGNAAAEDEDGGQKGILGQI
jgi:hypothetical protein